MAIQKFSGLKLGPGSFADKNYECEFFVDTGAPSPALGKDGDIYVQVPAAGYPAGGSDVAVYLKVNGSWGSFTGSPSTVALVDGQLVSATAISYPSAVFPYAEIEYTVRRGGGQGRKREGKYIILSDGVSTLQFSHEFNEIGADVDVPFTVSISAGVVYVEYTSVAEGNPIELKYLLKGWA